MISIGLPAIKTPFLSEAIQSVLDQKFSDFELIIYNDRSDEKIRNVVKSFEDQRIWYIEGECALPVVENWNRVFSFARGEYFILFSDDDRYHPDFLAEMQGLFSRYPGCDIFHSRVRMISARGELQKLTALCPEYETGVEFIFHRMNGDREQFAPEFAVKTRKLKEIGGFVDLPLAWGSDDLTWFQLAVAGGIAYSTKPLVDWRQSPYQISETGNADERLRAIQKCSSLLREFIETLHPEGEKEIQYLTRIKSLTDDYSDRQKAHLVAVNAKHHSFIDQTTFFLKNRKQHQLQLQWLFYSLYAKWFL
jgi:glycosyltransferase involved in cell wall biosynthesis